MVIDAHCHLVADWQLPGYSQKVRLFPLYVQRARAAGIRRSVLFANFSSEYGDENRRIAEIVRKWPGSFVGFVFVHAGRDKGRIRSLVRTAVESYDFRGIKVHRHDAPITDEVCMAAREFGIPLLYDVRDDVNVIPCLGGDYPDVDFIIPHLGSFADHLDAQQRCINFIARYDNIYADTSGLRFFDLLVAAIGAAGAEKIIFGSDGPWLHPGLELLKIRALQLDREREIIITGGNIARLLARRGHGRRIYSAIVQNRRAYPLAATVRAEVAAFDQ